MNLILPFFAAYLAIYLVLNLLAIRQRKLLLARVTQAKAAVRSEHIHAILDQFVASMTSMRSAILLCLVFGQMLMLSQGQLEAKEFSHEEQLLFDNGMMGDILEAHMASVSAVNPFFGAIAYALRHLVHLRFRIIDGDAAKRELISLTARYAG